MNLILTSDESQGRPDLALKMEVKYALPLADIGKLRAILEVNCRRLVYNKKVSVVQYLRQIQNKVRIRWYDAMLPEQEFYFEIKWRNKQFTEKHRWEMKSPVSLGKNTCKDIVDAIIHVLR